MDSVEFWKAARNRRRYVVLWLFCWVPAGLIAVITYHSLYGAQTAFLFVVVFLIAWLALGQTLGWRLRKLLCPRCGKPAISRMGIWERSLRCQYCGLTEALPN